MAYLAQGTSIVGVDLSTGDRTVVSGVELGRGPVFDSALRSIHYDKESERLVAITHDLVFVVDPICGDRAILSH